MRHTATLVLLLLLAAVTQGQTLEGKWSLCYGLSPDAPPQDAAWSEVRVPELIRAKQEKPFLWYKTSITLPKRAADARCFLRFEGVKFGAQVWLDGKLLGEHIGGWEAFEFDVSTLPTGKTLPLLVRVQGLSAVVNKPLPTQKLGSGEIILDKLRDALTHPIGSRWYAIGIWEPVRLVVRRPVFLDDVFIQTSTREKKIRVHYTLKNLSNTPQQVQLLSQVTEINLRSEPLLIPAHGTKQVVLSEDWATPKLWSPESPHLYALQTTLTESGGTKSVRTDRFGFREFWIEGTKFMLNGKPMHFLGTAKHPRGSLYNDSELSPQAARNLYAKIRTANCNAIRLHANLWPLHWTQVADEVGMPLILESALWCRSQSYALKSDVFWKNLGTHLEAMLKKHRNNPSFLMVSLCNEILHCGGEQVTPDCEERLAAAGRRVKQLDPTRPIMFDGDGDPKGVADVVNLHYPLDFEKTTNWPANCFWIDEGKVVATWPRKFWKWDRKKPLYLGEYLHLQHFKSLEPYSILLGDAAYRLGFDGAMANCKSRAWWMQTLAYRQQGVSGLCPWVVTEIGEVPNDINPRFLAVRDAYSPAIATPRELARTYHYSKAGKPAEKMDFVFDVINDTTHTTKFRLQVRLTTRTTKSAKRLVLAKQGWNLTVPLAEKVVQKVSLPLTDPAEGECRNTQLRWKLFGQQPDGSWKLEYERIYPLQLFPREKELSLPKALKIAFLGNKKNPDLTIPNFFKQNQNRVTPITSLSELSNEKFDTLIILPGALAQFEKTTTGAIPQVNALNPQTLAFYAFLKKGGNVLVLEQQNYPKTLLPFSLTDNQTTFAWPFRKELTKLFPLQIYNNTPSALLADRAIIRPYDRALNALLLVGTPKGLEHALAAYWHYGLGTCVLSQVRTTGRPEYLRWLAKFIAQPPQPRQKALQLHRATPENLAAIEKQTGQKLRLVRNTLPPRQVTEPKLVPDGDFFWCAKRKPGTNWRVHLELLPDIAPWCIEIAQPVAATKITRTANQLTTLSGKPELQKDQLSIYAQAKVAADFSDYLKQMDTKAGIFVEVTGSGTPVEKIYPVLEVRISNKIVGALTLPSEKTTTSRLYISPATLQKIGLANPQTLGLTLEFINDLHNPETKEDRNIRLQSVSLMQAQPIPGLVEELSPGARVRIGDILLDQVNWAHPSQRTPRAERCKVNLLAQIGPEQKMPVGGLTLPGAQLHDAALPKLAHKNGTKLSLGGNATCGRKIAFQATGEYTFKLRAEGTPCENVYPHVVLLIDGEKRGEYQLISSGPQTLTTTTEVAAGTHRVELQFDNDQYAPEANPPEDRNLTILSLQMAP